MMVTGTVWPGAIGSSARRAVSARARRSRFSPVSRGGPPAPLRESASRADVEISGETHRAVLQGPPPADDHVATACPLSASIASAAQTRRRRLTQRASARAHCGSALLTGDERPQLRRGRRALHPNQHGSVIRGSRGRVGLGVPTVSSSRRQRGHGPHPTVGVTAI
jgi:hypothetical protein